MRVSQSRRALSALLRPVLWLGGCNLLAASLMAQCTNPTQVPNQTISSGTVTLSDPNALKAAAVTINGSANVTFVAGKCIELAPGFHATAGTAATTFHAWVDTAPSVISVFPTSGTGFSQLFTWTVSSPSGYSNLRQVYALFNTSVSGANGCYIYYYRPSNALALADDAGIGWTGGFALGSSGSASNSYCTIYGGASSVSVSGNQLALTVQVMFHSPFAGMKFNYLTAYDSAGMTSGWQQMGIWTIPATPAIITSSLPSGTIGSPYSTTLAAEGGAGSYTWSLVGGALPSGLSLLPNGIISGTPSSAGTFNFIVQVMDILLATVTKPLSLTIGAPLTITTSSPLPGGSVGSPYSTTLLAAGGAGGNTWSLASGTLPGGLTLSTGGVISGTPSAAGTSNFTVRVTDSALATAMKPLSLTVTSAALTITTSSPLPGGTVGATYNTTLMASGGTPDYTWAVDSGTLPSGLTLSAGGTITGTPSAAGTFSFTVRVTDSASGTTTKSLSLTVASGALTITTTSLPGAASGVSYSIQLSATGGTQPYTWTMESGSLPSGLSLATNGAISGTTSATGTFNITVRVTDSVSATITQPLALTVAVGSGSPQITEYIRLGGRVIAIERRSQ